MTIKEKLLIALAAQIKQNDVKVPLKRKKPQKITDDNQAIHIGVIHDAEKSDSSLRSASTTDGKRK